jgi:hypothetical protein
VGFGFCMSSGRRTAQCVCADRSRKRPPDPSGISFRLVFTEVGAFEAARIKFAKTRDPNAFCGSTAGRLRPGSTMSTPLHLMSYLKVLAWWLYIAFAEIPRLPENDNWKVGLSAREGIV